ISFAASKDKSFEEHLIHVNEKKTLLPSIALYGANAAGKSNVLLGLYTVKEMVTGNTAKLLKGQKLPWVPFANSKKPTSFELMYIYNGIRYDYGFSYDENRIYEEYLYHWPNGREALIFSRDDGIYEFRENIAEQTTLSSRTPDNKLYLVSSNEWNLPQTENAYKWFQKNLTFLIDEQSDASKTVQKIQSGYDNKVKILKELMKADLGICDIDIKDISKKDPLIITTHKIQNSNGNEDYFELSMDEESAGTRQYFNRVGGWLDAIEKGRLLVVDEIEDSLHPLLTRRLIEMVHDKNMNQKQSQLLFTTHDALLLDLNIFRRDQIWFAEKNDKTCSTELYSLASFSPRKGENVRKGYLQGRFGAVPYIGE
ncbi:MAG: ATP/GTP-binding protein, partial [Erysipelotrichaceae bacterium]